MKTAISPTRKQNYAEWYQQIIKAADLAETSPVRGCMIIKPWGTAIWERIQRLLDDRIKATGHENIYCPLLIPKSFLEKEAQHVTGFAQECAVVTHHRLVAGDDGQLEPASPLEEPLIVRPTSETMIGTCFAKWIQSYRDLPLKINQWANVMRWEMRTRLFLRTSEFLWQEGHTAHASSACAQTETLKMLQEYARFAELHMAMPVLTGEKTASERFPGAESTYCIEAMMQDGKALQAGTSHFLGQNFSQGFGIQFSDEEGQQQHAWTTSWGVSTRLIGGLIMTHSDDDGLVLPPSLAPQQVVIMPLLKDPAQADAIMRAAEQLAERLRAQSYRGEPLRVHVDQRDMRGGEKAWSWVKKGVPMRIELGARELAEDKITLQQRNHAYGERQAMGQDDLVQQAPQILADMHQAYYLRAAKAMEDRTVHFTDLGEFEAYFKQAQPGFATAYYAEDAALEKSLKQKFAVTVRCLPLQQAAQSAPCLFNPNQQGRFAVFAKAY